MSVKGVADTAGVILAVLKLAVAFWDWIRKTSPELRARLLQKEIDRVKLIVAIVDEAKATGNTAKIEEMLNKKYEEKR